MSHVQKRRRSHGPRRLLIILLLLMVIAAEGAVLRRYLSKTEEADWRLILVNAQHTVPADYEIELTDLFNGTRVDSRIYPDLQRMFDAARAEGVRPVVSEGYRTHEEQAAMMQHYVDLYLAQGYTEAEAQTMARDYVAEPGTSEHELGIAVDINGAEGYSDWDVYAWLAENAYQYGFILRYPEGREAVTGIDYEPWHYRYVGAEAAQAIHEQQITLEEYLESD